MILLSINLATGRNYIYDSYIFIKIGLMREEGNIHVLLQEVFLIKLSK